MEKDVPYLVHEGDMDRLDRVNKRQWIVIMILIILLVVSNLGWLYHDSQFEEVSTTTSTETYQSDATDGGVAIANGDGEVNVNG